MQVADIVVHVSRNGADLEVRTACGRVHFEAALALCREIPGRKWDRENRIWLAPATGETVRSIKELFGHHDVRLDAASEALLSEAVSVPTGAQSRQADAPEIPSVKTQPWRHQRQAFWFCRERPAALLNMGMGTGKSKVVVDLVCNDSRPMRVLILCPKSVVGVWPRMFMDHGSKWCAVVDPKGSGERKKEIIESSIHLQRGEAYPLVIVLNYEAARHGFVAKVSEESRGLAGYLLEKEWDLIVLDESHRCKDARGLTGKFIERLRGRAAWRLCLTGTPMPHSPLDIFSQMRFLEPGIFGQSFTTFRSRYAVMRALGNTGIQTVAGFKNLPELSAKANRVTFTAETDDVLDLPPATDVFRTFEMEGEQRRVYDEMEATLVADVRSGRVTAANALVRLLRLQQITSGYLPSPEPGAPNVRIGKGKTDLLFEVMEEIGQGDPIAVFCRFHHDLDVVHAVAKELRRSSRELSGRRNDIPSGKWEEGDVLAVQIQSGGVGIDLTRTRYGVYFSVGYSLGEYEQSLARVRRPGQTRPVTYVHLLAASSVDEVVREALIQKSEIVGYVIDQMR